MKQGLEVQAIELKDSMTSWIPLIGRQNLKEIYARYATLRT